MELKRLNKFGKAQCACCGYYTIKEIAETCPVCHWEENIFQEENQNDNDAPNYISLREARGNFQKFGAKKLEFKELTREPYSEELEGS
jgi:hypothetical protein